jgi:hypothetical protein
VAIGLIARAGPDAAFLLRAALLTTRLAVSLLRATLTAPALAASALAATSLIAARIRHFTAPCWLSAVR